MKIIQTGLLVGLFTIARLSAADVPDVHRPIPELHLKDGTVLHNVKMVSFGSSTAMARWDGGRGTIAYAQLPDEYLVALKDYMPPPPTPTPGPIAIPPLPRFQERSIPPDPLLPSHGEKKITGQCFIVTNGGQNFKLGLVDVGVYPIESWGGYFDKVTQAGVTQKALLDARYKIAEAAENQTGSYNGASGTIDLKAKYSAQSERMLTGIVRERVLYDEWSILPPPPFTTKTDADGRFSLTHTFGDNYVVFARATRQVGEKTERYIWIVIADKTTDPTNVFLSNDNITITTGG